MISGTWKTRGPSILGYEPGWLWWVAALVVVVLSVALGVHQYQRMKFNAAYIDERIVYHANEQGLDVDLVRAVVQAESGGDWRAESPVGAKGLMQVTPIALADVQQRFGVGGGNLFNPDYNLHVGTLYLSHMLERFDGDIPLALRAYHMGPTDVARGKDPGPQTRAYVERVLELYNETNND